MVVVDIVLIIVLIVVVFLIVLISNTRLVKIIYIGLHCTVGICFNIRYETVENNIIIYLVPFLLV